MYKKLLLGLCARVCANFTVYAQSNLLSGAPQENLIVKEPLLFWDLMRDNLPSWIRYYRTNESVAYGPSNRIIQRKDATGRFNHLESSIWNPIDNKWILFDKHVYERTIVDGKVLTELGESWFTNDPGEPMIYQKRLLENTYDNNKLIKAINEISNESGVVSNGESYFAYNNLNQRIYDSSEINNYRFVEHHQYDNNNNCVANKTFLNGNLIANRLYKYQAGLLTEANNYYGDIPQDSTPSSRNKYTYNVQGKLTEAVISGTEEEVLTDLYIFKHGYTDNGKLKWLCSYTWENDDWMKVDSIIITYTNDKVDTSYGYLADENNEWHQYANFMFVFNEQLVGVEKAKNNVVDFAVYPNPTNSNINITLDATDKINHIAITNILGKVVYQHNTYNNAIDVTDLQPGIYFITIESNKGKGQKKIIIN